MGEQRKDNYNVYKIHDSQLVTLTKTNNIFEIQCLSKCNTIPNIKKLDSKHYVLLKTGEIKEFNKTNSRNECENSLRQTFKRLRYLINNNFIGADNELFVTLTYKDNMTDLNTLYIDFKNFIKRFKYYLRTKTSNSTTIDYISVVEPQQRGAWHCHVLFRFNDLKKAYIDNKILADLWGHGFVNIKKTTNIDNVGAYLTAYLTDLSIDEIDHNIAGTVKEINGKKYIKGARLSLYPSGANLYRCSRGIKKPIRQIMSYRKAKTYVSELIPTYVKKLKFKTRDFENSVVYYYYNSKRK